MKVNAAENGVSLSSMPKTLKEVNNNVSGSENSVFQNQKN
jgi:hypothetical protein